MHLAASQAFPDAPWSLSSQPPFSLLGMGFFSLSKPHNLICKASSVCPFIYSTRPPAPFLAPAILQASRAPVNTPSALLHRLRPLLAQTPTHGTLPSKHYISSPRLESNAPSTLLQLPLTASDPWQLGGGWPQAPDSRLAGLVPPQPRVSLGARGNGCERGAQTRPWQDCNTPLASSAASSPSVPSCLPSGVQHFPASHSNVCSPPFPTPRK